LRLALRNGYINKRYGYHLKPANILGYYLAQFFPARRFNEDRWLRHQYYPRRDPTLLDVGCGNGSYLIQMKSLGWIVEGVDPDPEAVEITKQMGITVHLGTLSDVALPESYFDAITFSHVIEHLHDPKISLEKCFRILRPGGLMWIATPNLKANGHRIFSKHWIGLDPPRHITLFTPDSLINLIRRVGFNISSNPANTTNWITDIFFIGSNAIALGEDPFHNPPLLTQELRWKARIANWHAWVNPELSEELILLAWKPKLGGM
jgi:SAM-dependent methyltransferase